MDRRRRARTPAPHAPGLLRGADPARARPAAPLRPPARVRGHPHRAARPRAGPASRPGARRPEADAVPCTVSPGEPRTCFQFPGIRPPGARRPIASRCAPRPPPWRRGSRKRARSWSPSSLWAPSPGATSGSAAGPTTRGSPSRGRAGPPRARRRPPPPAWCRFALGTETLGQHHLPVLAVRRHRAAPDLGRVSRHGAMALAWTMDKVGPDRPLGRGLRAGALGDPRQRRPRPDGRRPAVPLAARGCGPRHASRGRRRRLRGRPQRP